MKFWIGGLAKTATVGVAFCQLITQGKKQGVHAFVVPLRDKKAHKPLPGLQIGDCGAKIGMHGIDNGWVIFKDFRIPRDNLLDRIGQVMEDGSYKSEIEDKNKRFGLTLGALSGGRAKIGVIMATWNLGLGFQTARYLHLRRQFTHDMG